MKSFSECLGRKLLVCDGAYGTMLRTACDEENCRGELLSVLRPDTVRDLHIRYLDAGADIISTDTFGANEFNYPDQGEYRLENVIRASVTVAREAVDSYGSGAFVALDIGPTGKLVGENGDLDFEDAVKVFSRVVKAGKYGCDLVLLETFGSLAETRAALLAVKENCDLPVVVTNVYGSDGRTFTGSGVDAMCTVLEGMGADAVGMNCSIGPAEMVKLLPEFIENTSLPIAVNPNAGLPHTDCCGNDCYDVTASEFAAEMLKMAEGGAAILGGCCGTTPEYIAELKRAIKGLGYKKHSRRGVCVVSSETRTRIIGNKDDFTVIGERINPTGKPKLKAALRENNIDYLIAEAHKQIAAGADILDVNVGLPEIDESSMLTQVVGRLQSVTDVPLQLDSSSSDAMENALRRYNGKALVNSVNGSESSMTSILPLAAKYGGVVVALTLDEKGIPDDPEERFRIAERIVNRAAEYGISKYNIIVDPLTLTLGADPEAADKTLVAMKMIRERLGVPCSLGVSNISFGLPDREKINCDFLCDAMRSGLDAAIMNPCVESMMSAARRNSTGGGLGGTEQTARLGLGDNKGLDPENLSDCVRGGMKGKALELACAECTRRDPNEIISEFIIPALERVGADFETGKIFLPGLLASADAAISALSVVTETMEKQGSNKLKNKGKVVLATVEGDVHDIGKNIVAVMLRSYGFDVIDLGRDVPAERVLSAARESGTRLVGLSALMTTTLPSMEKTISLLNTELPGVKTVVGGAVLTEEYAARIHADRYSPDAMATVKFAREIYGE
ncbi:MAG: homocysteine S-methyltransferase family protein [Clostridia bacterium]|nr:homocysteine S-methyltransferase family protein [Clostridia bacterium]